VRIPIELERERTDAHYRIMIENSVDVVFHSEEGILRWISPAVEGLLGWTGEELLGSATAHLWYPDHDIVEETLRDIVAEGLPGTARFRCRHRDGHHLWLETTVRPYVTDDGRSGMVGNLRNVDQEVRAQHASQADRQRLRLALDSIPDPYATLEPVHDSRGALVDFVVEWANNALCACLRTPRPGLVGARLMSKFPGVFDIGLFIALREVFNSGQPRDLDDIDFRFGADDEARRFDFRLCRVSDTLLLGVTDVTERFERSAQLTHLATRDPLTGLANRSALADELRRAISAARRNGTGTAMLAMDLDHFKEVNDSLGHPVGDLLLQAAADRLTASVRSEDFVARTGGDEFIVVMRNVADVEEAISTARRIVEAFRQPFHVDGNDLYAATSVGVAIDADRANGDEILRHADMALYMAKRQGRSTVAVFDDEMRAVADARRTMERELRPALERSELMVWYQTEIDLATDEICGVEALLRWQHPDGSIRDAGSFIGVAEEAGLIAEIGTWVLDTACQHGAQWAELYPAHPIAVHVNLSPPQLLDTTLPERVAGSLQRSGLDPRLLCIEVHESALRTKGAVMRENVLALRALGVQLAVDDFGAGNASLLWLRDWPIDVLKLDRSFTRGLVSTEADLRLIAGIIAMATIAGISVTGEGIESAEQAEVLRSIGGRHAQGFHYSRAVPAAQIDLLLASMVSNREGRLTA
jgi:diguanylate cyclase (GGDEF)-like protein/PAS domain S-box-containing protein